MNDRFKLWDVVIEVDDFPDRKFVVEQVLKDGYIVRSAWHPKGRMAYGIDYANHMFVKVGRWDCKAGREIEDAEED